MYLGRCAIQQCYRTAANPLPPLIEALEFRSGQL
jgi:hypothetical protein